MSLVWSASQDAWDLLNSVKDTHHKERLDEAAISVAFVDNKPFTKNRFNWGKVSKFSDFNKIWMKDKYNFCIQLCADVWQQILKPEQREALLDLHLSRCDVEYVPETIVENGKKIPVVDQWGRPKYTTEKKLDENGEPKWIVNPLDLVVFTQNVKRYGLWCDEIHEFGVSAMSNIAVIAPAK